MHIPNPADWLPQSPDDLIGPAGVICRALLAKARRPATAGQRILLTGSPGCGKSTVCDIVGRALVKTPAVELEVVSGKNVNVARMADWLAVVQGRSLWGGISVTIIEELDKLTSDAVILALQWLDLVKRNPMRAVYASSNDDVGQLDPRLQSRFQHFPVGVPPAADIERFLRHRCGLPGQRAKEMAATCGGDLRAALNDAQSWLDVNRASGPCLTELAA